MNQRDLVVRARDGDHDAFAALVDQAVTRLDGAARLIVRDPELARDAVQEALIRAWRDLPGLRDPEKFGGWLHRLMVHACLDLLRRRRRRAIEVRLDPLDAPSVVDPSARLAEREILDGALRRLDPERRALVVGHVLLGMPLAEIAAATGIPLGTAKSRLHRALGALREMVTDEAPARPEIAGGVP